jgi:hypothetical protein
MVHALPMSSVREPIPWAMIAILDEVHDDSLHIRMTIPIGAQRGLRETAKTPMTISPR